MGAPLRPGCLCPSVVPGGGAIPGCGSDDDGAIDPLLVPWARLTGRSACARGRQEVVVRDARAWSVRRVYESPRPDIEGSNPKLYLVDPATGAATQLAADDGNGPVGIPQARALPSGRGA
jgi:hypothetical protein